MSFDELVEGVLEGDQRSLARLITYVENGREGYRDALGRLHREGGDAYVVGVTGSPGTGKSTLVDGLVELYRERGDSVGVVAIDPSSPFTGGSILGDRIRMGSVAGDSGVFFRSMSARGELGGLASATRDAVTALDAFGKDVVVVETVGAGQNEVDVVRGSDSVVVLVTPGSGDDVQMLKAGILEIGDVFVVNKADMEGSDRMVMEVEEMVDMGFEGGWRPRVVETVADSGVGLEGVLDALDGHREYLVDSGELGCRRVERYGDELRDLLEAEFGRLSGRLLEEVGGLDGLARRVAERETDPYSVVEELMDPVYRCVEDREG